MRKDVIVFGLIISFLVIAIAPSFNAETNKFINDEMKPFAKVGDVEFEVIEFKSDGSIEKTIVKLTLEESNELKFKLKEIKNSEEKLFLYKEYGIIPEDVTLEKLKKGMQEKAERFGLTEEILSRITKKNFPILSDFEHFGINSRCFVFGSNGFPLRLIFGLSSFTRIINCYLQFYSKILNFLNLNLFVPSIDLINSHLGFIISFQALDGKYPDINFDGMSIAGILLMIGFVGFYFHASEYFPFFLLPIFTFMDTFVGYSAFILIAGNEFTPYR
jgi:hypothetical protein